MADQPPFTTLVRSLPSNPPFVAPEAIERQRQQIFQLRLGANESPYGPSPAAQRAMSDAIGRAAWYGDPECFELREELARRLSVKIENVVVGSGIDDLLGLVVRTFLDFGDIAVSSLGGYPTFGYHVVGYGGRLREVPYLCGKNDLQGLVDAARCENARMVYLSNPDNPTGTWYEEGDLRTFRESLPPTCLLVLDQAYIEFAPRAAELSINVTDAGVISLRTFSKAHGMAGTRIGYGITSAQTIAAFNKLRLHFGVNRIAQSGALASLKDHAFVKKVVHAVAKGRQDYERLGRDLGLPTLPSATNFVALDVGSSQRADALVAQLLERDVFIRKPSVAPLNRYIRLSVGQSEDREVLADILRELLPNSSFDAAGVGPIVTS
jgi:histidinol-phosphate aminotransferase